MKVERIASSLQPRVWSLNRQGIAQRQIAMLTDGAGEAEIGAERIDFQAPAVIYIGDQRTGRLRVEAGTTGYRGTASDASLVAALGEEPESRDLARLSERNFALSLAGQGENGAIMERCFEGMLREGRQPGVGAALVLSALLRIMLVTVLRVSAGDVGSLVTSGERAGILQRFRQLVELNFRNRWTVQHYAQTLGISADRLHAICTAAVGRSPKALISERLAHEAMLRLERSPLTIEQFAHSLGFNDPAHFSVFFRRMTGQTPARYRAEAVRRRESGSATQPPSFADWP